MTNATFLQGSTLTQLAQIISPADPLWQQCLNTLPHDFYHLAGYLELEAHRYGATAEATIVTEGEQVFFLAYLIRDCDRLTGLAQSMEPIYDVISPYGYPGILVNQAGQNPGFIKKCLNLIYDRWQQQNICSAFIRLHPILNSYIDSSISTKDRFVICPQGDVVVCDLKIELDDIWKQMRRTHRNKIDKLRSAGFTARIVSIDKYLDVFIDIYQETMDRVNAASTYYFTRDYFQGLMSTLGDGLSLCIVEAEGRVIAASLVTEFSGIVQYHLGGTKTEFLPRSPATIMVYHIIEWAKHRNNRYVNLGGGMGGSRDSLYQFKSGFSDLSKPFSTIKTIVNDNLYDRLTCLRAESLGMTVAQIKDESFFPVYRLN